MYCIFIKYEFFKLFKLKEKGCNGGYTTVKGTVSREKLFS